MKKKIFIIAIISFLIDQISKIVITNTFSLNETRTIIKSFFSLSYIQNTGAAWGLFEGKTILLAIISLIFLYFFVKYIIELKSINKFNMVSLGLILGGIVGNLFDRIVNNYVIDFLSFRFFSYNFPVFNLADTFIVVGIILIIIETFIEGDKNVSK